MKKILFIIITLSLSVCDAQNSYEYKEIIATLSSDSLAGRGYVDNGIEKAQNYIEQKFKAYNIQPWGGSFTQDFFTSVNTFPEPVSLFINNDSLIAGKDFIAEPYSSGLHGEFFAKHISYKDILFHKAPKKIKAKEILIIDAKVEGDSLVPYKINRKIQEYIFQSPAISRVIINSDQKLTWGVAQQAFANKCIITIHNYSKPIGKITTDIRNTFIQKKKLTNIIAHIPGSELKDSFLVFTAHYDHLGKFGNAIFPGANDNASGVALLLELARYFKEHPPRYSMLFIALSGEELGILGANYYVNNPLFPLGNISFLWNFDLAGTGEEGIQIVNSTVFSKEYNIVDSINNEHQLLPKILKRGEACNSDHCPFYEHGVKCFYSYTRGGIAAYHDIYDKYETLPLTEFEDYLTLVQLFIENYNNATH